MSCTTVKLHLVGAAKLQALVYDILPSLEEGAAKRCSECGVHPDEEEVARSSSRGGVVELLCLLTLFLPLNPSVTP